MAIKIKDNVNLFQKVMAEGKKKKQSTTTSANTVNPVNTNKNIETPTPQKVTNVQALKTYADNTPKKSQVKKVETEEPRTKISPLSEQPDNMDYIRSVVQTEYNIKKDRGQEYQPNYQETNPQLYDILNTYGWDANKGDVYLKNDKNYYENYYNELSNKDYQTNLVNSNDKDYLTGQKAYNQNFADMVRQDDNLTFDEKRKYIDTSEWNNQNFADEGISNIGVNGKISEVFDKDGKAIDYDAQIAKIDEEISYLSNSGKPVGPYQAPNIVDRNEQMKAMANGEDINYTVDAVRIDELKKQREELEKKKTYQNKVYGSYQTTQMINEGNTNDASLNAFINGGKDDTNGERIFKGIGAGATQHVAGAVDTVNAVIDFAVNAQNDVREKWAQELETMGNTEKANELREAYVGYDMLQDKHIGTQLVKNQQAMIQSALNNATEGQKVAVQTANTIADQLARRMYGGTSEVGEVIGLALAGTSTFSSSYRENLEKGFDRDVAFGNAVLKTGATVMTEKMQWEGMNKVFDSSIGQYFVGEQISKMEALLAFAKDRTQSAVEEGLEEVLEDGWHAKIDQLTNLMIGAEETNSENIISLLANPFVEGVTPESMMESFVMAFLSTQIQGLGGDVLSAGKQNTYNFYTQDSKTQVMQYLQNSSFEVKDKKSYNAVKEAVSKIQEFLNNDTISQDERNYIESYLGFANRGLNEFNEKSQVAVGVELDSDKANPILSMGDAMYKLRNATEPSIDDFSKQEGVKAGEIAEGKMLYRDGQGMLNQSGINLTVEEYNSLDATRKKELWIVSDFAKTTGLNVSMVNGGLFDVDGKQVVGQYDPNTKQIVLDANASNEAKLISTLIHETTHFSENSTRYNFLLGSIVNEVGEQKFNALVDGYMEKFGGTRDNAIREVTAMETEMRLGNQDFLTKLALYNTNEAYALYEDFKETMELTGTENSIVRNFEVAFAEAQRRKDEAIENTKDVQYSYGGQIGMDNMINSDNPEVVKRGLELSDKLGKAKEMFRDNVSMDEIWRETGWIKKDDDLWRYEFFDDAGEASKNLIDKYSNLYEDVHFSYRKKPKLKHTFLLNNLVPDSSTLFEMYPDIKWLNVVIDFSKNNSKTLGYYTSDEINGEEVDFIVLHTNDVNGEVSQEDIVNTFFHELQHAIQAKEFFEGGSSTKSVEYKVKERTKLANNNLESLREKMSAKGLSMDDMASEYFRLMATGRVNELSEEYKPFIDDYKMFSEDLYKYSNFSKNNIFDTYYNNLGEAEARESASRTKYAIESGKTDLRNVLIAPRTNGIVKDQYSHNLTEQDLLNNLKYDEAVNNNDMETAQKMVDEKANSYLNSTLLPNDNDFSGFKYHRGSTPKNTIKRYAVFNVTKDGLKPAYAGNDIATPVGVWLDAQNLESYTSDKKYDDNGNPLKYILGDTGGKANDNFSDEKLNEYGLKKSQKMLLLRGGKHASDVPNFSQMNLGVDENGNKVTNKSKDGALPSNKLVFEIDYGVDENLTDYVKEYGRIIGGKNQGLENIGPNQFYDFKTNPNAIGNWALGGTFRITRLVPYQEIVDVTNSYKQNEIAKAKADFEAGNISKQDMEKRIKNAEAISVQKWVGGYHPENFNLSVDKVNNLAKEGAQSKLLDAITYDDNGNVIPLSERFNPNKQDIRYSHGLTEEDILKGRKNELNSSIKYGDIEPSKNSKGLEVAKKTDIINKKGKPVLDKNGNNKTGRTMESIENAINSLHVTDESSYDFLARVGLNQFVTNKKTFKKSMEKAKSFMKKNGMWKSLQYAMTADSIKDGARDTAMRIMLMDEMKTKGYANHPDFKPMYDDLITRSAQMASLIGQDLVSQRMFNLISPQRQIVSIKDDVARIEELLNTRHGTDKTHLTVSEEFISEYENPNTTNERRAEMRDELAKNIAGQIKASPIEKIYAWRYLAMLGNPKTWGKNFVANFVFGGVSQLNRGVRTILESAYKKKAETKDSNSKFAQRFGNLELQAGWYNVFNKQERETYKKARDYYYENHKNQTNKYSPTDVGSLISSTSFGRQVQELRETWGDNWVEKYILKPYETVVKFGMSDSPAMSASYSRSMVGYLKAQNLTWENMTETQKAKADEYAYNEALKDTFNQANEFASKIIQFTKGENANEMNIKRFVFDALMPFKRTPLNIAKTAIKYSPIGLVNTLTRLGKQIDSGNITANEYIDNLSSGLTGTGIACLGALLSALGIFRTKDDDKERKQNFDEENGEQDYSIVTPWGSYTIDWLDPTVMPLSFGAQVYKVICDITQGKDVDVAQIFGSLIEPLLETTMLQDLTKVLKGYKTLGENVSDSIMQIVTNYAGQFIPSISGALARTIDDTRRTTYPNSGVFDKFIKQSKNKIPFLSKTNQPYINLKGEEEKNEDFGLGFFGRALQNFLSPGYWKSKDDSEYVQESNRLYESTGEGSALPSSSTKDVTYEKTKYDFTDEEYTQFAKTRYSNEYKLVNEFMASDEYQEMDDDERILMIDSLRTYAGELAKAEILEGRDVDIEGSNLETKITKYKNAEEQGISPVTFTEFKKEASNKGEKVDFIFNNENLDEKQKKYLFDTEVGSYYKNTDYQSAYEKYITEKNKEDETEETDEAKEKTPKSSSGGSSKTRSKSVGSFSVGSSSSVKQVNPSGSLKMVKGASTYIQPSKKANTKVSLSQHFRNSYKELSRDSKKVCPYCGATVPKGTTICPECGKHI